MDLKQAEIKIKRAWLLSAIAIPGVFVSIFLSNLTDISIYLLMPWLFPGILGLPELVMVTILTFMLHRKSRVAAVLLFLVFILDKGFTYIWLHHFSQTFIIIWLCITLIWGIIFVQGIMGTFVYHHLKDTPLRNP